MSTSLSTIGEIRTEFLVRADISTTVAFATDTIVNNWLDQAHKFVTGYKKWPNTEGRVETTFASLSSTGDGYLVGGHPEGWKQDSIRQLQIGGKRLQKVNFYKFQRFVEDNPNDTSRIFSDYGGQVYINPRVDLTGSVVFWGQYTPSLDLTDYTAGTVFSNSAVEANEAIVELMISYLKLKQKKPAEMEFHQKKALDLMDRINVAIQDEQFGYQSTNDEGMWKRFDVLEGGFRDDIIKRDQF